VLACGDNLHGDAPPLAPSNELFVVAHPDDDLLLMQPDLLAALRRGGGVTTVYVTAGNGASSDVEAAMRRYEGVKSAYGYAAGDTRWQCGAISLAGHRAEHCRIDGVSLVFLGYPDGGKLGEHPFGLLQLWRGEIASATTISTDPARYDRAGLVATLTTIIHATAPATIRTLEVSSSHGRDHPDHQAVGALSVLAIAAAHVSPELVSYRGYAISDEPPNKVTATYDAAFEMLARYEACATDCAACGEACTTVTDTHVEWLRRRYAVGFRRSAGGQLRLGTQCLNQALDLVACSAAPPWTLDAAGELRVYDRCIEVADDGSVSLELCIGGKEHRFFLDDEGNVVSGVAPRIGDAGDGFLSCLSANAGRVELVPCGAEQAQVWSLAPSTVLTARDTLGFSESGRYVRLGDIDGDAKADLCAIANGLSCALGNGRGGFSAASRVDSTAAPLAIDPQSLVLGDVDGDRHIDACGRDESGVLCATAASGFAAQRWSSAFSAATERPTTSSSLAAVDADADGTLEICGFDQNGVSCAPHGATPPLAPMTTWPDAGANIWIADLDGDARADWCSAAYTGPACAVDAARDITTDGTPWGYANRGAVDLTPDNTALVAIGDIDGDGRADLCTPTNGAVACARSQGTAFGPRTAVIANLSAEPPLAHWLGDLDGDGRMDSCVDLGATIACAVQP
jgi:LmbE family N-acetylglucosaminyl deacetylase